MRYKAIIAYDGTDFEGFQRQNDKRTVQGELEKTLKKLNSGKEITVHGSGRTDSGVHALGQVIHFDLNKEWNEEKLRFALDTQIAHDISVKSIEKVSNEFHSRYNKHHKYYKYTIDLNRAYNPMYFRYAHHYIYDLNIELMKSAAKILEGTHDFTSFCAAGSSVKDKVRTIYQIDISHDEKTNMLEIKFFGDGFLYKMIRIIVGVLLAVGNKRLDVLKIEEIIAAKNRDLCPPTAPAKGLCLMEVTYDNA